MKMEDAREFRRADRWHALSRTAGQILRRCIVAMPAQTTYSKFVVTIRGRPSVARERSSKSACAATRALGAAAPAPRQLRERCYVAVANRHRDTPNVVREARSADRTVRFPGLKLARLGKAAGGAGDCLS